MSRTQVVPEASYGNTASLTSAPSHKTINVKASVRFDYGQGLHNVALIHAAPGKKAEAFIGTSTAIRELNN
jgi:hypothetical protein